MKTLARRRRVTVSGPPATLVVFLKHRKARVIFGTKKVEPFSLCRCVGGFGTPSRNACAPLCAAAGDAYAHDACVVAAVDNDGTLDYPAAFPEVFSVSDAPMALMMWPNGERFTGKGIMSSDQMMVTVRKPHTTARRASTGRAAFVRQW